MKFLNFILVTALLLTGTFTSGYAHAFSEGDSLIANPGFENGKSKWTASVPATFSVITSAANVGEGKVSAQLTCTASGQYVESTLATVANAGVGKACLANVKYKGGTGVKVVVRDATNPVSELALLSSTGWAELDRSLNFPCPSQVKVRFECTSATGSVSFDNVKVEENRRIVNVEESHPVGSVVASMLTESQFQTERGTHWVLADGRSVAGSKFATLFGSSTLPDLRGVFLRGKNNSRSDGKQNPDGEVALGVYSADKFTSHTHDAAYIFRTTTLTNLDGATFNAGGNANYLGRTTSPTAAQGGNETAGKNVTVNYFIKINDAVPVKTYTDSGYALRAGQVITGAYSVCPAGTLETNGDAVLRTTYPELFAAIGTSNGDGTKDRNGNPSGNAAGVAFNLPNYNGMFLRGHANGSGNDPDAATRAVSNVGGVSGDNVGSWQAGTVGSHNHNFITWGVTRSSINMDSAGNAGNWSTMVNGGNGNVTQFSIASSGSGIGSENRPKNVSVKYCIQIKDTNIVGSFQQVIDNQNFKQISANYTLTSSDNFVYLQSASATVSLPQASTVPGKVYNLAVTNGTLTISPFAGDAVLSSSSTPILTASVAGQDSVSIQSNGAGGWIYLHGTGFRQEVCYIGNNGTASIQDSNNCNRWVASLSRTATGRVQATFYSGLASIAPGCTVTNVQIAGDRMCNLNNFTSSMVEVQCENSSAGTDLDVPFVVQCKLRR